MEQDGPIEYQSPKTSPTTKFPGQGKTFGELVEEQINTFPEEFKELSSGGSSCGDGFFDLHLE